MENNINTTIIKNEPFAQMVALAWGWQSRKTTVNPKIIWINNARYVTILLPTSQLKKPMGFADNLKIPTTVPYDW